MWGFKTLLLVLALDQVHGYAFYRKKIPNGMNVPHPCKKNSLWDGVGHLSQTGGGKRNPFGQDFKDQGFKWTTELCRKDSDKDGKTNGEELGIRDISFSITLFLLYNLSRLSYVHILYQCHAIRSCLFSQIC